MIPRILKIPLKHSFFLFGPRGTGKTTLLNSALPSKNTVRFDLLEYDTFFEFQSRPRAFAQAIAALPQNIRWVFIDEVQKLPQLLDEIHRHIESNPSRHFALTGSSARKLKRGQANLLAGRAFTYTLAPLTSTELGDRFDLDQALWFGTLPKVWELGSDEERGEFLRSYAHTYIKEEIQAEGLVRNLSGFQHFVPLSGKESGNILSWNNIAQDAGINAKTVRGYFEILEDTLLGFFLPAYRRSLRKRQRTHPKFYFFDPGVRRAIANELTIPLIGGTAQYGQAFEHFWILEIIRLSNYRRNDWTFSYVATNDSEVDLVIERPGKPLLLVEIKSSERVKDQELRGLRGILSDTPEAQGICICRESHARLLEPRLRIVPWQEALESLELV